MASQSTAEKDALDTQAVNNFREYLRIPTVHPNINYGKFSFLRFSLFRPDFNK
jgi:hypothetical protein